MADQTPQTDLTALSQVLAQAKMHLDEALGRLPQTGGPTLQPGTQGRMFEDTNSGCNTSCAAQAPVPGGQR
jgi:hypothetical protein